MPKLMILRKTLLIKFIILKINMKNVIGNNTMLLKLTIINENHKVF